MGLLEMLLDQSNEGAVGQVGRQFGLDSRATRDVMGQLVPAISGALRRNSADAAGLGALAGALARGRHAHYLDDVDRLGRSETVEDGNAILGHLLGKRTIADFVENQEILGKLRDIGVDYAQGYAVEAPFVLDAA